MHENWYQAVIRVLCESSGIPNWPMVAQAKQIEVSGYPVALFEEPGATNALALYVELMPYTAKNDAKMLGVLLESNITSDSASGFFGLVPHVGIIAYRASIRDAHVLSGQELMTRILDLVSISARRLHETMSRDIVPSSPRSDRKNLQRLLGKGARS